MVFHESADSDSSSGLGMKSWYLSFQVVEAVDAIEGFLPGDDDRPVLGPYRAGPADGGLWISELDFEVPGRRRPVDSLCSP